MASGFDKAIYSDFHQAKLQLYVTQSYTTQTKDVIFSVLYSGSWILLSGSFSRGILSVRSISISVFLSHSFLCIRPVLVLRSTALPGRRILTVPVIFQ
jgi:hypothetical protein